MKAIQLYLNSAGHCLAKEHHALWGGQRKNIQFKALFGLIKHDKLGWILYDTGYTDRFYDATHKFPSSLYAKITKVEIEKEDEVVAQLKRFGIQPQDIKHIIITHFHADHVGGLKDFPNATVYCSKEAYHYTVKLNKTLSFSKGVLKDLLPDDLGERVKFIEDVGHEFEDEIFGTSFDLFGDNSILTFNLPGHAAGQIGIKVRTAKKTYFLMADACWTHLAYKQNKLPHPIVRLLFSSWKDYKQTVDKLSQYHQQHPDVIMVPTHCNETLDQVIQHEIDLNVL
ncbi:MAG: glyoxylase-like metal-dependent hydrolase (beta-lactamase superfamily II) [Cryomorphaceae bacterium]|jgi:glyoxylase-like metal-dependent hydrolase (beta-lactamase superfamily II)